MGKPCDFRESSTRLPSTVMSWCVWFIHIWCATKYDNPISIVSQIKVCLFSGVVRLRCTNWLVIRRTRCQSFCVCRQQFPCWISVIVVHIVQKIRIGMKIHKNNLFDVAHLRTRESTQFPNLLRRTNEYISLSFWWCCRMQWSSIWARVWHSRARVPLAFFSLN